MENYKGFSPWGGIQGSKVVAKGLKFVCTASHGGYMVTSNFAKKYLSKNCQKYGLKYKDYLCYEEDSAYSILEFEIIDEFGDRIYKGEKSFEEYKVSLIKSLSYYFPEYLIEKGVTPNEKEYKEYLENKKREQMRAEKNPDLIISVSTINKEIVRVITANNKEHFISKESYRNLRENSNLLLISKCEKIEFKEVI